LRGGDHPQAAGYIEAVRQQCAGNPRIEFCGYVPEDALPDLFQSSAVAVMPYHRPGMQRRRAFGMRLGVPIVSPICLTSGKWRKGKNWLSNFIRRATPSLADCLVQLLEDSGKQQAMATQNFLPPACA